MQLDRDEFLVTYSTSKATTDDLISIIRKAGYDSSIVTDATKTIERPHQEPREINDPVLTEALAIAKAENKLVLLDFMAKWCVPCKRLEKETFADPTVAELLNQLVLIKIDTDEHPELAKHFGVVGLPDLRFLKSDGSEVKRLADFQDAELFTDTLKSVLPTSADLETTSAKGQRPLNDITEEASNFRQSFNDSSGNVRVVMLVSPG